GGRLDAEGDLLPPGGCVGDHPANGRGARGHARGVRPRAGTGYQRDERAGGGPYGVDDGSAGDGSVRGELPGTDRLREGAAGRDPQPESPFLLRIDTGLGRPREYRGPSRSAPRLRGEQSLRSADVASAGFRALSAE